MGADDELKGRLADYLGRLVADGRARDAAAPIPEPMREWLWWLAAERFAAAALCVLLAGVVVWCGRELCRAGVVSRRGVDVGEAVAWAAGLPLVIGLMCGATYWTLHGTKAAVAPRVVLVEQVAEMVGRNR